MLLQARSFIGILYGIMFTCLANVYIHSWKSSCVKTVFLCIKIDFSGFFEKKIDLAEWINALVTQSQIVA